MTPPAPLRLSLDTAALVANWRSLAGASGRAACGAAIKANGYGLGAGAVFERLADAGCRDFFVATWAEAEALGPVPDGISLSVLHGVRAEDMPAALASHARPVLNTFAQVARWRTDAVGLPCDVMVDTGMNRLGLSAEEARSGLLDGLSIDTLHSHLACADTPDHPLNEQQLFAFRALRGQVQARRHSLANSAGICLGRRYALNLTRPGLALYGGVPAPGAEDRVRRVVRVEAQVLQRREVPAGVAVGYGGDWVAARASRIAIVNLGYADGYLRALGGGGVLHIGGAEAPVVGRISMDLLAVDVTDADVAEGDWLELPFDLAEAAGRSGLSQYELLTSLGHRYERRWT